jgi:hypothetical protein
MNPRLSYRCQCLLQLHCNPQFEESQFFSIFISVDLTNQCTFTTNTTRLPQRLLSDSQDKKVFQTITVDLYELEEATNVILPGG